MDEATFRFQDNRKAAQPLKPAQAAPSDSPQAPEGAQIRDVETGQGSAGRKG